MYKSMSEWTHHDCILWLIIHCNLGAPSGWFLCRDKPPFLSTFLLYGIRYSRLILYSLCFRSEFPQGALVPFIEEQYLETKIWTLYVLTATGVSLPLGPLSSQG